MKMFDDARNWKKTSARTLTFSYLEHRGKLREQSLEKRPDMLFLQLERLSLFNNTSWQYRDKYNPEIESGFSTREYITGFASLIGCRIYGVALDDTQSVAFVRLEVQISPIELEKLKDTTHSLASFPQGKVPEGGPLADSLGELVYYWADDGKARYWPVLYAKLYLDYEHFSALARNIQAGGIRSARLEVLADLYGLDWGGTPGADADYVILLEDEGLSKRGRAKARLNEVTLEWSPVLDTRMGSVRDEQSKVEAPTKFEELDGISQTELVVSDGHKQQDEQSNWSSFFRISKRPRA